MPHDSYTLANVVSTVAVNLSAWTVAVSDAAYFLKLASEVVELSLYICETVDTCDDLSSILTETVKDNAEMLLTNLVSLSCDLDSTLSCSE